MRCRTSGASIRTGACEQVLAIGFDYQQLVGLAVPKSRRSRPPSPFPHVLRSFREFLDDFWARLIHLSHSNYYMNYYTTGPTLNALHIRSAPR
jgi:hypothetical protein